MTKNKKIMVSLPDKIVKIIDGLVETGDYSNRSQFIHEATLSHLRTWYPKEIGEKEVG